MEALDFNSFLKEKLSQVFTETIRYASLTQNAKY
jgi:hypothetical protein